MNQFNQSWTERKHRRGIGMTFFRPPGDAVRERQWHQIETHLGLMRLQWRPGIDVWHGPDGTRWTAEAAHAYAWRYVGLDPDQSGGRP